MHLCIYSLLVLVSVIHSNSSDNFTNSINDNNINKNDNDIKDIKDKSILKDMGRLYVCCSCRFWTSGND